MGSKFRIHRRGSVLPYIFGVMAVLITLVGAIHLQQSMSRAVSLHEESALDARVASQYAVARQIYPSVPWAPFSSEISGKMDSDANQPVAAAYGANIYTSGFTDTSTEAAVSFDSSLKAHKGANWNQVTPQTLNPAFSQGRKRYLSVSSTYFPYAAYAPNGAITVDSAWGWSNPTIKQKTANPGSSNDAESYSGQRIRMAAKKDITLNQCRYGEVYSETGNVTVKKGSVAAFAGLGGTTTFAQGTYAAFLTNDINNAENSLRTGAVDKTSLFTGGIPTPIDFIKVIFGDEKFSDLLGSLLSVRQAMAFPFLMIPGANFDDPPVFFLWFHMPFAPDGGASASQYNTTQPAADKKKMEDDQADIAAAQKTIDSDKTSITSLQTQLASESDSDKRKDLQKKIDNLNDDITAQQKRQKSDADDMKDVSKKNQDTMSAALASSQSTTDKGPQSREAEKTAGLTKNGKTGWAYGPIFSKILDLFKDIFSGNFKHIPQDFYQPVRIVHFGNKKNEADFQVTSSSIDMKATFNVPPGRSLKINADVTIRGDLWLQKGSCLVVGGNLALKSPAPAGSFTPLPFTPQGRLFLDEGATLVVSGNFSCEGGRLYGSVLQAAPYGKVHPGTSAIFCDGTITIPWGIFPAFTLTDIESVMSPSVQTVFNDFNNLAAKIIPNLSKLWGAFHTRMPFFASYCTTFELIFAPPIIDVPIPLAIPLPTPKNINNTIFRVFSNVYTGSLNLALGDNFSTQTDWWFLGNQRVPMIQKVDPTIVEDLLKSIHWPTLPSSDSLQNTFKNNWKQLVVGALDDMIGMLTAKIVAQTVSGPAGMLLDPLFSAVEDVITKAEGDLNSALGVQDPIDPLAEIDNLESQVATKISQVAAEFFLHECPTLLVYAKGDINVGSSGTNPAIVNVGYMVAQGNINCAAGYHAGSLVSLNGNINASGLLFNEQMTRVSVYQPKTSPDPIVNTGIDWINWALTYKYGPDFASGLSYDIGPRANHVLSEGWKQ